MTIDELTPTELMKRLLERHFASFYSRFAYWLFVFCTPALMAFGDTRAPVSLDGASRSLPVLVVLAILVLCAVGAESIIPPKSRGRKVDFDPDKYMKQVATLAGLLCLYCFVAEKISMTSPFTYYFIFVVSTALPQLLFHRPYEPIKPISLGEWHERLVRSSKFQLWLDCVCLVLCIPVFAALFTAMLTKENRIEWLPFWGTFWFFCIVLTPIFAPRAYQRWREG